jgi:hypothetical protein
MTWLFPWRHQHSGDYQRECLREIRGMYYQPDFVPCAAELEKGDDHAMGRHMLLDLPLGTGTACRRLPSSGKKIPYQTVDIRLLIHISLDDDEAGEIQRLLQCFIASVQNLVTPDRSADPSRMKLL